MRKQKVLTGAIGLGVMMVLFALAASAAPAPAPSPREIVRITVLTCPLGCGIYEWWAIFERIFEKHPWLRVASQETPGFVYNLKEMAANKSRWPTTLFGGGDSVNQAAEKAIAPFFDKPIPSKPWKLTYPISGFGETVWVWATLNPAIQTMKDFEGKRLGLGVRGQINWGFWPTVFLEALGIKAKLEYLGPLPALEALLDGRVDVAMVNLVLGEGAPPYPQITAERFAASGRKFFYVSWDPAAIDRLKEKKGYTAGAEVVNVPPSSLAQQDKPLIGFQNAASGWLSHESFPEEIAYEFTKFMIQHGKELAKYARVGEFFVRGKPKKLGFTDENTHPGAVRAYKEFGMW